jgi:hypothetical protein
MPTGVGLGVGTLSSPTPSHLPLLWSPATDGLPEQCVCVGQAIIIAAVTGRIMDLIQEYPTNSLNSLFPKMAFYHTLWSV